MRIGIASAQLGRLADPAAIRATAQAAEQVGYSTLWVLDRLPVAIEPRSGYGGFAGVPFPPGHDRVLDPFVVLASVAAATSRVRLGTSVLVAPWYPPVVLARLLTSLDVVSAGRLSVGLGTGWSVDEYEAAGTDMRRRGRALEETLDVLDAHWSDGPIVHDGERARIAPSKNLVRPVQQPRPPLFLAAYTPAALDRVARRSDGWMPEGFPVKSLGPVWRRTRELAFEFGRDPEQLQLVVRANIDVTDSPLPADTRVSYSGTIEQVIDDVEATRAVGADEIILHVQGDRGLDATLDVCARIADAVGVPAAA
jgi:probable F420-dependent oxidoreductase